jgi:hypothetical protein
LEPGSLTPVHAPQFGIAAVDVGDSWPADSASEPYGIPHAAATNVRATSNARRICLGL